MSVSTHVLDASSGRPAIGVGVHLAARVNGGAHWRDAAHSLTDEDGRVSELPGADVSGQYRITFDTGGYFSRLGIETFYPEVTVVFEIADPSRHYHVPLLLSPFAYTTYRGS